MSNIAHGELIGSNYEQARLAAENAHLRKSAAHSDRDYWYEEAGRLAEQLRGAVAALRNLVRLVESIDYEDDIGDAEAVADATAILAAHRMSFIEHWACPEHARQENIYYAMDDPTGWRCNVCGGEAVKAEVVPVSQLAGAVSALREIVTRPTVERNPDGDDQAAHTMQMIAREALDTLGGR